MISAGGGIFFDQEYNICNVLSADSMMICKISNLKVLPTIFSELHQQLMSNQANCKTLLHLLYKLGEITK